VFEAPLHLRPGEGLVPKMAHGRTQRLHREQAAQHASDPRRRADILYRPRPFAPSIDVLEHLLDEWEVSPYALPRRADEANGRLPGRCHLLLRAGR
jgi:hypothetical protein